MRSWLGETPALHLWRPSSNGLRLTVPENMSCWTGMDDIVAGTFDRALSVLSARGCAYPDNSVFPCSTTLAAVNAKGGFAASEGLRLAPPAAGHIAGLDMILSIRVRIGRGEHMNAADYIDLVAARVAVDRRIQCWRRRGMTAY